MKKNPPNLTSAQMSKLALKRWDQARDSEDIELVVAAIVWAILSQAYQRRPLTTQRDRMGKKTRGYLEIVDQPMEWLRRTKPPAGSVVQKWYRSLLAILLAISGGRVIRVPGLRGRHLLWPAASDRFPAGEAIEDAIPYIQIYSDKISTKPKAHFLLAKMVLTRPWESMEDACVFCRGTGHIPQFSHYAKGVCFRCHGTGVE